LLLAAVTIDALYARRQLRPREAAIEDRDLVPALVQQFDDG